MMLVVEISWKRLTTGHRLFVSLGASSTLFVAISSQLTCQLEGKIVFDRRFVSLETSHGQKKERHASTDCHGNMCDTSDILKYR